MLIGYDELKRHFGGSSRADVAARLKKMGIRYLLRPDGRPVTTLDAVNAALKMRRRTPHTHPDEAETAQTVEVP
ncbi:MAG: DUF4224 domain-containing protein [Thiothrix sp.]|nr:DUF4224 domain-containing protein [Thiothrix sp.]HPQ96198.1 DUF4224 domain-containing protein [Thiolinea sp.]